jgi:hypothetical protein
LGLILFTHFLKTLRDNKAIQIGLVLLFLAVAVFIMVNFDLPDARLSSEQTGVRPP